jgi:hypothetical protein
MPDDRIPAWLSVAGPSGLRYLTPEHAGLRLGPEFCANLLPSFLDAAEVYEAAQRQGMGFGLVTPYLPPDALAPARSLLEQVAARLGPCELTVNDWGLWDLARTLGGFTLVLGRVLNRKRSAPDYFRLAARQPVTLPEGFWHYSRTAAADNPVFLRFMAAHGIAAVEYDNVVQGLDLGSRAMPRYLHVPWVYVTTTRRCAFGSYGCGEEAVHPGPCGRQCLAEPFRLDVPAFDVPLYLRGNTQFYRQDRLPEAAAARFDRLIVHPELPF